MRDLLALTGEDLGPTLDRVTYRDGQRLTSQDLRDDAEREARLWRLHSRYLHATWGIVDGLEVGVESHFSGPGSVADVVTVAAGHAIDSTGADILLRDLTTIVAPSVDGVYVLTIRSTADHGEPGIRAGAHTEGRSGRRHALPPPVLAWRRPGEARFGSELPLLASPIVDGVVKDLLGGQQVRRYVRPLARPRLATGVTETGHTGWRAWTEGPLGATEKVGIEAVVVTTGAGFTAVPCYFAMLIGALDAPILGSPDGGVAAPAAFFEGYFDPPIFFQHRLTFLTQAETDRFTFRIVDPHFEPLDPTSVETDGWQVAWFAVEPTSACAVDARTAGLA